MAWDTLYRVQCLIECNTGIYVLQNSITKSIHFIHDPDNALYSVVLHIIRRAIGGRFRLFQYPVWSKSMFFLRVVASPFLICSWPDYLIGT